MKRILARLMDGETLSVAQAVEAFDLIMSGQSEPAQTAALLTVIQMRRPTAEELAGAAKVMRARARRVHVPDGLRVVDTCGTGGDHAGTFNISTASALVVAGAGHGHGLAVAKHGNRAVTGRSGSSEVLHALGVKLEVGDQTLTRCMGEAGIAFCYAPAHHPAMKHAAPVREALGFRTLFNLVGPLTNPAAAQRQVIGVYDASLTILMARVLSELETHKAMVVHGEFPTPEDHCAALDELSVFGLNHLCVCDEQGISSSTLDPADLGISHRDAAPLMVSDTTQSAALIRRILAGEKGPARDIVLLNAAAALQVGDVAGDWAQGLAHAAAAIDEGLALRSLETLVQLTQAD